MGPTYASRYKTRDRGHHIAVINLLRPGKESRMETGYSSSNQGSIYPPVAKVSRAGKLSNP
jgi:hypothetical protein